MSLRIYLIAAACGAAALSATHGAAYLMGRASVIQREALSDARDTAAAGEANAHVGARVNEAGGRLGQAGMRTAQEAADARREIERHAAPAQAGTVGAGALVDPGLSRPLLCRIERLRGNAEGPACADAAAHRAEPGAEDGRGV